MPVTATPTPLTPPEVPHLPPKWTAVWITSLEEISDAKLVDLGYEHDIRPFGRAVFSREVALDAVPAHAWCHVVADSRYVLAVNGTEVGAGPVRSQPDRLCYDTYDVAGLLRRGTNTIEATVTYCGTPNAFWMPPRGSVNFGKAPCLALEMRDGNGTLLAATDASWTCTPLTGWSLAEEPSVIGAGGLISVPNERYDATVAPAASRPASVPITTHHNSVNRSTPAVYPYNLLRPRPIANPETTLRLPARITVQNSAESLHEVNPVLRAAEYFTQADLTSTPPADWSGSVTVTVPESGTIGVGLDFGRIVFGRTRLDVRTGGERDEWRLSASQRETYSFADRMNTVGQVAGFGAHAVGELAYRGFESNGFRYLLLLIEAAPGTEVVLSNITLAESLYPFTGDHAFTCDDAELNALYAAGRRTVALNSKDAFTDCPTREQRAWVGDGWVHQLVHLTCSDDWRLAARYVELADSPRSDGLLPKAVSGETEFGGWCTIPDWSLYWIHGLAQLHDYAGDLAVTARHLPTARRILAWYADYIDSSGLVADASEWNLVDWSATFLDGRSALINGLFALALGEYARMSADVGNAADAAWARELLAGVKAGFEDLWDPQRHCYVDHVEGTGDARAASQLANALPLLAGIVPEDRVEDVVRLLTDTEHLVVRSWIGANGVYDEQLIIDNIHGVQRVTWDTETEHVRAEPFASALVHEALAAAGRTDAVVDDMRRWSEFLADGYDTFGECWGWGTPCHGWSSCPTSDLVRHVLGVRPEQPGFARAVVAPRPDLAPGLHGSAPTPAGPITVACTADAARVTSPVPFTFITPSGSTSRHDAGEYILPLQV